MSLVSRVFQLLITCGKNAITTKTEAVSPKIVVPMQLTIYLGDIRLQI